MDEAVLRALLMSLAGGMATMLGYFSVYFIKRNSELSLCVVLSFAAGVILCVSFTDLLPVAYSYLSAENDPTGASLYCVFFLLTGAVLIYVAEKVISPSPQKASNDKKLYKLGIVSVLAMAAHNFPEGIATFLAGYENAYGAMRVMLAVAFHNIPEGITVALPLYVATGSKRTAFKFTLASAVSEPLGALCAYLIFKPFITNSLMGFIFAFTAGIMIYISLGELLYQAYKRTSQLIAVSGAVCGICFMLILQAFF